MKENFPLISVIVPVHNEEETIEKSLNSILNLDYPNYEVIVVNDGSTDGTSPILAKFGNKIKVISTPGIGPAAARNIASKQARGEYLAFTDGDCLVEKNWLKELLAGFTASEVAGVGGDQLSPDDETEFGKFLNKFMKAIGLLGEYLKPFSADLSSSVAVMETEHNPSCNVMYKKEIFFKVGYFLENLWPGEDVELDYRIKKAGFKLLFNPKAIVYHYRPNKLKKFVRMMYHYGRVQGFLVRRFGIFRRIQLVPAISLMLVILLWELKRHNTYSGILFVSLLSVAGEFYFYQRTKNLFSSIKYLILLPVVVVAWLAGFFWGLVAKR